jgi:hypothetical protein
LRWRNDLTGGHWSRGANLDFTEIIEQNLYPCSVFCKDNSPIANFSELITFKIITELEPYRSRGLSSRALSRCGACVLNNGSAVVTDDNCPHENQITNALR